MTPSDFVQHFGELRASAILRTSIADAVEPAMSAAVRGGFRIVEFTLTSPNVYEHISDFAARDGLIVGAGTVLTPEEARRAVDAGARFLVSPVVDDAVIATAIELGVAMMPGCHTPTEMLAAHRAGAPLQKLFPAPGGGPAYLRSCLGPLPFLRIVPTNGADESNAADWLGAGAHALGFVAPLFDAAALANARYDEIEARARALLAAVAGSD